MGVRLMNVTQKYMLKMFQSNIKQSFTNVFGTSLYRFSEVVKDLTSAKKLLPNNYYVYKDVLLENTKSNDVVVSGASKYVYNEVIKEAERGLDLTNPANYKTAKQRVRRRFEKMLSFMNPADLLFTSYASYESSGYIVFSCDDYNYTELDLVKFCMCFIVCFLELENHGFDNLDEDDIALLFKTGEQKSVADLDNSIITILGKKIIERGS